MHWCGGWNMAGRTSPAYLRGAERACSRTGRLISAQLNRASCQAGNLICLSAGRCDRRTDCRSSRAYGASAAGERRPADLGKQALLSSRAAPAEAARQIGVGEPDGSDSTGSGNNKSGNRHCIRPVPRDQTIRRNSLLRCLRFRGRGSRSPLPWWPDLRPAAHGPVFSCPGQADP